MYATHMESSAAAAAARKADVMSSSTVFDPICRGLAQHCDQIGRLQYVEVRTPLTP